MMFLWLLEMGAIPIGKTNQLTEVLRMVENGT